MGITTDMDVLCPPREIGADDGVTNARVPELEKACKRVLGERVEDVRPGMVDEAGKALESSYIIMQLIPPQYSKASPAHSR